VLALLGTVDLDEMIAENKPAEVVCNYCTCAIRSAAPNWSSFVPRWPTAHARVTE